MCNKLERKGKHTGPSGQLSSLSPQILEQELEKSQYLFHTWHRNFGLTKGTRGTDPTGSWFQGIYPTIRRRYAKTPSDIAAETYRRAVHGQQCSLPTGTATAGVLIVIGVCRPSPDRVGTFKSEHGLGNVRFDEQHRTGSQELGHNLRNDQPVFLLTSDDAFYICMAGCRLIGPLRETDRAVKTLDIICPPISVPKF